MPCTAKPFLTPHEARLAKKVDGWLNEKKPGKWMVLWKIHPSVCIKKDDLAQHPHLKIAYFCGVVAFALVERKVRGRLVAAVIDERTAEASSVEELLTRFGVECLKADIQSDEEQIKQFIEEAVSPERRLRRGTPRTAPVSNSYESWLRENIQGDFKRQREFMKRFNVRVDPGKEIYCFQEASLADFVSVPTNSRYELRQYAIASRVDFLFTRGPSFTPHLVIEFDGPDHEKPYVKERDKLKEEILTEADIPLLRLKGVEMPFVVDRESVIPRKNVIHIDAKTAERVLMIVLKDCLALAEYKSNHPDIWSPYLATKRKAIEECLRRLLSSVLPNSGRSNKGTADGWIAEYANTPDVHDYLLLRVVAEYKDHSGEEEIPEDVLKKIEISVEEAKTELEAIEEKLEELANEAMLEEYSFEQCRLGFGWAQETKYKLRLYLFGSMFNAKKEIIDSYPCLRFRLETPKGTREIYVPLISFQHFGKKGLPGVRVSFDLNAASWGAAMLVAYECAYSVLDELNVPTLIAEKQYRAWEKYWNRKWTRYEDERLRDLHEKHDSIENIADSLDRSPSAIRARLSRLRKEFKDSVGWDESEKEKIALAVRLERAGRKPGHPYLAHPREHRT